MLATLWAACIGGAMQVDKYVEAIERAGLRIETVQDNPKSRFISDTARGPARRSCGAGAAGGDERGDGQALARRAV